VEAFRNGSAVNHIVNGNSVPISAGRKEVTAEFADDVVNNRGFAAAAWAVNRSGSCQSAPGTITLKVYLRSLWVPQKEKPVSLLAERDGPVPNPANSRKHGKVDLCQN
jgi:hypothetical protein